MTRSPGATRTSTPITGRCHCGNIAFTLDWPDDASDIPARACGCSFCRKHGGVWAANRDAALVVRVGDASLVSKYAFGTKTADFHVCARCGAVPLVTCELDDRLYAVVNVNVLDAVDPSRLRRSTADFEAEAVEARLDRRRRHWIAQVRFVDTDD